jgi:hypothetical protein
MLKYPANYRNDGHYRDIVRIMQTKKISVPMQTSLCFYGFRNK